MKLLFYWCFCIFLVSAQSSTAWADEQVSQISARRSAEYGQKRIKLAGRAGTGAAAPVTVEPAASPARQRKLLTLDERRALRRQVNETEGRYPAKN